MPQKRSILRNRSRYSRAVHLLRFASVRLQTPSPAVYRSPTSYKSKNGAEVLVIAASDPAALLNADPFRSADTQANMLSFPSPDGKALEVALRASLSGLPLQFDDEGRVIAPVGARQSAEEAISEFADLMAVIHHCQRIIESPTVCVALEQQEEESFGGCRGAGKNAVTSPKPRGPF